MLLWSVALSGRFEELVFESDVLKANPVHDPYQRPLWVYLPPGYDAEGESFNHFRELFYSSARRRVYNDDQTEQTDAWLYRKSEITGTGDEE